MVLKTEIDSRIVVKNGLFHKMKNCDIRSNILELFSRNAKGKNKHLPNIYAN